MKTLENTARWSLLAYTSLIVLTVFALANAMPSLQQIPDTDSAIFQYFGQRMREGQLPYRDIYDHKPPSIFYLEYLGLSLGGGSRWGIWALEVIAVGSAALLAYAALRRFIGSFAAWIASAGFLANLTFVFEGGNLTEEYALPFQFAAIYLFLDMETRRRVGLRPFLIGVALACASTLKQPLAGPVIAIAILMLANRIQQRNWHGLLDFVWLGLGFTLVWAGWFAWFAFKGILPEFWEAAFAYNFALSEISPLQRIDALFAALGFTLTSSPYYALAYAAWAAAGVYLVVYSAGLRRVLSDRGLGLLAGVIGAALMYNGLVRHGLTLYRISELSAYRYAQIIPGFMLLVGGLIYYFRRLHLTFTRWLQKIGRMNTAVFLPLLAFAFIDLPVEILISSISGNNFAHYFMALLPSMTLLVGFFTWSVLNFAPSVTLPSIPVVWASVLIIPLIISGAAATEEATRVSRDKNLDQVIRYVEDTTSPTDYVLQWGDYPQVNTMTGRKSPSRFFFIDPLFLPNYTNRFHTGTFLSELKTHPPVEIVDFDPRKQPLFYQTYARNCPDLTDPPYLEQLVAKIVPDELPPGRNPLSYKLKYFTPPQIPEGMPEVYLWICQNYSEATHFGGWIVLRYTPGRP